LRMCWRIIARGRLAFSRTCILLSGLWPCFKFLASQMSGGGGYSNLSITPFDQFYVKPIIISMTSAINYMPMSGVGKASRPTSHGKVHCTHQFEIIIIYFFFFLLLSFFFLLLLSFFFHPVMVRSGH